ncbi:MAG TPA: hypothetical protein VD902_00510 [Symbiobacteriaceae bacterium]|nr:hypothetical protein [Symbiobacteriaceae bacterium]
MEAERHAGKYRHETAPGRPVAEGSCQVALDEDGVYILPDRGGEIRLYYSDIDRVLDQEWHLSLAMCDGQVYTLYFLGSWYGQCVSDLRRLRGNQLTRNLLMLDGVAEKEFQGAYSFLSPDGLNHSDRSCKITLYRTSLVVEPQQQDFWSAAYADVEFMQFDQAEYALRLQLDLGERIAFSMLGTRFGELEREIKRLTEAMYTRTAANLQPFLPEIRQSALQALSRTLRQGRAIHRDALHPEVWGQMQHLFFSTDDPARKESFTYLTGQAAPEHVFIGLREPFTASAPPICWFVVAFPDRGTMAVEVTNEEGNATYVYRLSGPVGRAVTELSRAMVALNFRRDVISASDKELEGERMARYRVALRKLPHVRRLREMFVGKAAHTTAEAWQRRMDQLLKGVAP